MHKHSVDLLKSVQCAVTVSKVDRPRGYPGSPKDVRLEGLAFQFAAPVIALLLDCLPLWVCQLSGLEDPAQSHVHNAALLARRTCS